MKAFSQFMEESNQVLLLQIQEEISYLEEQLSVCEDEELAESIASRLRAVKRRGAGIAKRAAIAGLAAAAVTGGGGAARAADFSGNVNVSRGAVPAQATSQSVRSAVSKAIANPGQSQSASSEKGRMKTTVSGGINVSGKIGGGGDKKEKENVKKERGENQGQRKDGKSVEKPKFRDTLAGKIRSQQARRDHLLKRNKFKTQYKYAVPSSTGGRWNSKQASGSNQYTDWKAVGTNKTGGTNWKRTKVVGDPQGTGSTGNVVRAKKYDKLFGPGGKYAPDGTGTGYHGTGTTKYVPSNIGKPFNPKGYRAGGGSKFVK